VSLQGKIDAIDVKIEVKIDVKTLLFLRVMGFQNGGPFLFPDSEKLLQS